VEVKEPSNLTDSTTQYSLRLYIVGGLGVVLHGWHAADVQLWRAQHHSDEKGNMDLDGIPSR